MRLSSCVFMYIPGSLGSVPKRRFVFKDIPASFLQIYSIAVWAVSAISDNLPWPHKAGWSGAPEGQGFSPAAIRGVPPPFLSPPAQSVGRRIAREARAGTIAGPCDGGAKAPPFPFVVRNPGQRHGSLALPAENIPSAALANNSSLSCGVGQGARNLGSGWRACC